MANFEHLIEITVDNSNRHEVFVAGNEAESRIDIIVTGRSGRRLPPISWIVDWERKAVTTDLSNLAMATDPQISCVAACLVGAAGSLANCLLKARSKADVWKCVEENAVSSVFSGLGCVLACF